MLWRRTHNMTENSGDISSGEVPYCTGKTDLKSVGLIAFLLALAATGAILLGLYLSILKLNDGTFIYTMDDPYIGLSLSDQIRHANYGINAGLHAAPASSILYPFLLATASGTPLHPFLPLVINVLALFVTMAITWRLFVHLRLVEDTYGVIVQAIAVLLMALCLNLVGVVFSGLEHNLHIAVTAACIYGLVLLLDTDKMPAWLPAMIVLAPLLRYEGLTLSIGAILVLALRGRWRAASGTLALIVLFLGGFSAFLVSMGLPPLPSSVLTKSNVAANGIGGAGLGFFKSAAGNLQTMFHNTAGCTLLVIGVVVLLRYGQVLLDGGWRWTSRSLMALVLLCMIGGHAVAGRFGWLYRYEDYLMVGAALIGIYLMQGEIRNVLADKKTRLIIPGLFFVALAAFCFPYLQSTWQTSIEANNIYEQQFQMHHFVNDYYRAPVAVNDLGLVSYHNPNFVLDLGGLASEQARILQMSGADADAYRDLVARNGVHLVIIYDEWFPDDLSAGWVKVASLALSRQRVSSAEAEVQFYATDAATASKVRPELQAFSKVLPPRVRLTVYGPATNAAE